MKKQIFLSMLFSLITLSNVVGTPDYKKIFRVDKIKEIATSISNKKEHIKTGAALTSSALLGWAAIGMPFYMRKLIKGDPQANRIYFKPSSYLIYPCGLIDTIVDKVAKTTLPGAYGEELSNLIGYNLPYAIALLSGVASIYLAKYGITKYRALKKSNSETTTAKAA